MTREDCIHSLAEARLNDITAVSNTIAQGLPETAEQIASTITMNDLFAR